MNNRLEKVIDAIYPLVCDSESTVEEVAEAAIAAADATREVTDADVKAGMQAFENWDETFFEQLDEVDAEELVRYIQQAALKVTK